MLFMLGIVLSILFMLGIVLSILFMLGIVLSILPLTTSKYPFCIFKHFLIKSGGYNLVL